jgi:hypothetical protein
VLANVLKQIAASISIHTPVTITHIFIDVKAIDFGVAPNSEVCITEVLILLMIEERCLDMMVHSVA